MIETSSLTIKPGDTVIGLVHSDGRVELFGSVEEMLKAYGEALNGMTALKFKFEAYSVLEVRKETEGVDYIQ